MRQQLQIVRGGDERTDPFARVEDAVAAIRDGKMLIVVDDEARENEGDLTIAAEKISPEDQLHGSVRSRINLLGDDARTAFCVSIEAKEGTTTGISAADRATTVLASIDAKTKSSDLARPGHIFPLRARSAGVLARAGQTEATVDLARMAGLRNAGVIRYRSDGSICTVASMLTLTRQQRNEEVT